MNVTSAFFAHLLEVLSFAVVLSSSVSPFRLADKQPYPLTTAADSMKHAAVAFMTVAPVIGLTWNLVSSFDHE